MMKWEQEELPPMAYIAFQAGRERTNRDEWMRLARRADSSVMRASYAHTARLCNRFYIYWTWRLKREISK